MSTDLSPSPASDRRYDLDWIRVGAFGLLILYHIGMFYVPWDWHVKSSHSVDWLETVMMLTNPWRLTLLFLVSGCATRFIADGFARDRRNGASRLAGSRTLRLLPPLVFAMFVIVPPQSYYEILEQAPHLAESYASFWVKYATASGNWCDADECPVTPTWNHLWFVAYLFVYSLILALMLALAGRPLRRLGDWLGRVLDGWGLLIWPILFLALIRLTLAPLFEITHGLTDDWYNHALSFAAFLFGFLIARSEPLKDAFIRLRWPALGLALVSYAGWATYAWIWRAEDTIPPEALRMAMRLVYAIDQWAFIAAILGFGARHLTQGGPILRYLTIGVFPFYIAHQTIIVVAAYNIAPLRLSLAGEFSLLIAITALGCWLTYELARRIGWFGLMLGVRPQAASTGRPWPHRPAFPG